MRRAVLAAAAVLATACTTTTGPAPTGPPTAATATPTASPSQVALPSPSASWTWPPTTACGHERWAVKTGTDPDATLINIAAATPTTIAALVALPAPATLPAGARMQPTETTVWQIHATLTGYKMEADSDYHLILSDGTRTMIAEIPDPSCVSTSSPLLPGIEQARSQFDARYTPSSAHFTPTNIPVTVDGVGFFDYQHGQDGVAPNAIELHPVLDLTFGSGS